MKEPKSSRPNNNDSIKNQKMKNKMQLPKSMNPKQEKPKGGWGSKKSFSLVGGNKKKTSSKKKRGSSRLSTISRVGNSKKSKSYQMKGGWGEDETETTKKTRPYSPIKTKTRKGQNNSSQNGGGWGGARTIHYNVNSRSPTVVSKYFRKHFH